MKIVTQFIDQMSGVEIFPIIALVIFIFFFILMVIWVLLLRNDTVEEMKEIPFEKDENSNQDINI